MKKILIAIFILCSVQSFGQATFRIKDSTLRFMTGTLTSKVPQFVRPMYGQEFSRNNSSTLKMLVLDTARAALGLKAWYWQDIPSGGGGGSGLYVDTIYRKPGQDSIFYTINGGTERAIKDSIGSGGGGTPGGSDGQFQSKSGSSFAGSSNLTQGTNQILATATSSSVAPIVVRQAASHSANTQEWQTSGSTNLAYINSSGRFNTVQNISAFYGLTQMTTIGYARSGNAGIDIGASGDATIDRTGTGTLRAYVEHWKFDGRAQQKQGADVASAKNLSLGTDGNAFEITGTTTINLISNTNWQNGSEITLLLASGITVKHGQTTSGSNITISLSGAADLVTAAETALTLVLSEVGGTQKWREKHRVSY